MIRRQPVQPENSALFAELSALLDGACSVRIGGLLVRAVRAPAWMAANDSGKKEPFFFLEDPTDFKREAVKTRVKGVKVVSPVSARAPHP